jgi:amino-acid N-acetyltransferase
MSPTLVEVRSLAVLPQYRGLRIGQAIVRGLVDEARRRV